MSQDNKSSASSSLKSEIVYQPPLDFTFKCLTSVPDCLEEDPRQKGNAISNHPLQPPNSSSSQRPIHRTKGIRFSNNVINDWRDFSATLNSLIDNPGETLEWIDMSFNDLPCISPCLLEYKNLRVLYLHGNGLEKLSEVDKLGKLPFLKNLTLHGNPMEETDGYRHYVLSRIPQLENLDFSGVTKSDRACSERWRQRGKRSGTK